MNKKFQKLVAPGMRLYLLVMVVFAVATFFVHEKLAMIEAALIVILIVYSLLDARRRRRQLVDYIEGVTYNAENAKKQHPYEFPSAYRGFQDGRLPDNLGQPDILQPFRQAKAQL